MKYLVCLISLTRLFWATDTSVPAVGHRNSKLLIRSPSFKTKTTVHKQKKMDENIYGNIVAGLRAQNVRAVVFDFDCTISKSHSGGRVRNDRFRQFLENNISPCFRFMLPRLLDDGFQIGVATFADAFMAPDTHIAGDKMIRAYFQHHFGSDFSDRIPIIAAYPANYQTPETFSRIGLTSPMSANKSHHLAQLAARWGLPAAAMVLVDDDADNVDAARAAGYPVRWVRSRGGVSPDDMLRR